MRFNPGAYGLALTLAIVALPFQIPTIRSHAAWAGGSEQTMGHVDQVIEGRRITEVNYSYEVNGKPYKGGVTGGSFLEGTPEMVTYAKNDPSVSTLLPHETERLYLTACIIAVIAILPLLIMVVMELATYAKSLRKKIA